MQILLVIVTVANRTSSGAVLRYKPVLSLEFFIDLIFRPHYGLACNRKESLEYFLGCKGGQYLGLTILPSSCAHCLETWGSQPLGTLRSCPGLYRDCFTFMIVVTLCNISHIFKHDNTQNEFISKYLIFNKTIFFVCYIGGIGSYAFS